MSHPASVLLGTKDERVALCGVSVEVVLRDLLAEVTTTQTYRNDEGVSIEAVYTFPLPLDAVLLDLSVTIGGRRLKGTVVAKKAAEKRYEDAVAAGSAAVMLEQLEPGLYTMNVGNLLPNETAVVAITYAVTYRWTGDSLRMLIPTTIAPRYGTSPHEPHQTPESSLTVENQFSLQVEVYGSLREARFECPSHDVTLASSSDKTLITLSQTKAAMDRDFILGVKAPQAAHSFALCGTDVAGEEAPEGMQGRDGAAVVAVFQPVFPGLRQPRALDLAVVIDCSGSMQGDSITQAKQALAGILDGLQPRDRVTIVAFGNATKALSGQLLPCTDANLQQARRFAADLEADMGGTEIGHALQAAYAATSGSEAADVFLVTDGEVSEWTSVVAAAKKSGRRIFTVGVGNAVSEALVRELAAVTGGESELVSPREGMPDRVVRHFERMRAPRAKRVVVHWPEGVRDQAPARLGAVFEGDTVFASARFDRQSVTGHAVLEIETESGQVFRHDLVIGQAPAPASGSPVSTVARLAASARLKDLDQRAGAETAIRYQLASPWTNWIVVAERPDGEQVFEIPEIRKVPQTLAAGWGGVGLSMPMSPAAMPQRLAVRSAEPRTGDTGAFPAYRDDEAERLEALLSEFGDLSRQIDRLGHDVAARMDHARVAIDELQDETQRLLTRVMSELHSIERRVQEMQRALEERGHRAGTDGPQNLDAIRQALEHLAVVRERLRYLQELPMRLERCRILLREVEDALRR